MNVDTYTISEQSLSAELEISQRAIWKYRKAGVIVGTIRHGHRMYSPAERTALIEASPRLRARFAVAAE